MSPQQELLELEAIKQLKARYFRLMDTCVGIRAESSGRGQNR